MEIIAKAQTLKHSLTERLDALQATILRKYPVSRYIEYLDAYPEIASYGHVTKEVKEYSRTIRNAGGTEGISLYHRILMLTLIVRAIHRLETHGTVSDIATLYCENFTRIISDIELDREPGEFYDFPAFSKELALCSLRLIPAGVQKICVHTIPRSWLVRRRPVELLTSIRLVCELGGVKPIYEMHTDSRDLKSLIHFTPQGWEAFYKRVAALLDANPGIRGVGGTGWFFDPQLERVSPELAYVRQLVVRNGGTALRLGPCSDSGIQAATRFSPTRHKHFKDGDYTPANYLVVWPRRSLLAWARTPTRS